MSFYNYYDCTSAAMEKHDGFLKDTLTKMLLVRNHIAIHDLFHAAKIRKHWEQQGHLNTQEVDWEVVHKANAGRTVAQHLFDVKRISGYLGVGKWLVRWKQ
jgi:hypothetical protein